MMRSPRSVPVLAASIALFASQIAAARDAKHDDPAPSQTIAPQTEKSAPVSTEPQQTSASFGDWVVRCERPVPTGKRVCEAAQSLIIKGQQGPIAQIAFGHPPSDKGVDPTLSMTVLLPVSIAFDKPPKLAGSDDANAATLTFRRCLPGGCIADGKPAPDFMKDLRGTQKPGHLTFTDAAERSITLPVSYRGLAQALDDLAKEIGRDAG